jgi:hypothetical protein
VISEVTVLNVDAEWPPESINPAEEPREKDKARVCCRIHVLRGARIPGRISRVRLQFASSGAEHRDGAKPGACSAIGSWSSFRSQKGTMMTRLLTALVLGCCLAACSSSTAPSRTTTTATSVSLVPNQATLQTGHGLKFFVVTSYGQQSNGPLSPVLMPDGPGFAWSVAGMGCSGASCGTIDATGRFTAPAAVPDPAMVTVTATSVVDSTKSLEATVTLIPFESFSMNPTSVDFGKQMIDTASASRAVTVTNTGSTPQPVHGRFTGAPGQSHDFAQTSDCPSMLAVGASCTFNVTFTPSATGTRGATLNVDGIFDEEGLVNVGGTGTN